jgi:ketosteroid isomerase-like protein
MTPSETVLAMLHASDTGDLDALRARLEPDCEWRNPMIQASGADEIVQGIAAYAVGFSMRRHELSLVLEQGATVALEGEWVATHTGPLATPEGEIPPTGRTVRVPFAAVVRVRGERVSSVHLDPLGFMAQLGPVPERVAA